MHTRILQIIGFAMAMLLIDTPAIGETSPCDIESASVFEDWAQWEKLTPTPVRSHGHSNAWVDIYADELARDTYLSAGSPYPECATVVKPQYTGKSADKVRKLTIMVKMPAGYDPGNGDWWYAVANREGEIKREGELFGCIRCHRQAKDTDYMFSRRLRQ